MSPIATTDLDVCLFIERIARDRYDIDILSKLLKKVDLDQATICDDGY